MGESQSAEALLGLVQGHAVARCLHVIAEAGVADALAEAPASASELANSCGLDADALHRMLRLLSSHGVFAWDGGRYIHTSASRLLRSDHPRSMRSFARMVGMPVVWNAYTQLDMPARTGKPALDWPGLVSYFSTHPVEASLFNQAMAEKSAAIIPHVTGVCDFSRFGVIADIGGGRGHLLQAILRVVPTATGILFDLPHVIAEAANATSPRLRLLAGDFLKDSLPAADAYVLMEVLHDWPDEEAGRILAAVRRAAPLGARLLIVEALVADTSGPHFGKMLDVVMLAVTGGRERSKAEYESLLGAAGFRLEQILPTASPYSIVEAIPV